MNSGTVQDRMRTALAAQAGTYTASPDAWQRTQAKAAPTRHAGRARRAARFRRRSSVLLPAAAAAVVVAVIGGAVTAGHVLAGSSGVAGRLGTHQGPAAGSQSESGTPWGQAGRPPVSGTSPVDSMFLGDFPPVTPLFGLRPAARVRSWFWMAYANPQNWDDVLWRGKLFCHDVLGSSGSSGFCMALPPLGPGRPAIVTGGEPVGIGHPVLVGAASSIVASVTAVFPDGQKFAGQVGTGQGFGGIKAWTVTCPVVAHTKLIFRDAAGQVVATISTAAPQGPPQVLSPPPGSGPVPMFTFTGGTAYAFRIQDRVGLYTTINGIAISPVPAAGPPAVNGIMNGFSLNGLGQPGVAEAYGYAHADVVRVVLRLPGRTPYIALTLPARWPGSDLRLWWVPLPGSVLRDGPHGSPLTVTATGYDAAGHVVGTVKL